MAQPIFYEGKHTGCCQGLHHARRDFLKLASLGAGAALFTANLPGKPARADGHVDALLLSCMDYRLVDGITHYMDGRGMANKYDHIVLAGAALGAQIDLKPEWGKAFWDHVDVAKELHHIHKVIVLDHRDCGAYKVFLGPETAQDPMTETKVHSQQLATLAGLIRQKHPDLEVETLLMALDGTVETVLA